MYIQIKKEILNMTNEQQVFYKQLINEKDYEIGRAHV